MSRNLWTREELVLTLNLYLKIPFGKIHSNNPVIINLAKLIGRTPSSVSLRLSNFAACDPYHSARGVVGMRGGIPVCKPIWDEFNNDREKLIYESEIILTTYENTTIENKFRDLLSDIKQVEGKDISRLMKTRINQNVFRQIVLANYHSQCAISEIDEPDLLIASHIIPWSENEKERMNPENGICFSALYDKAYDKGLIGINTNYEVLISTALSKKSQLPFFKRFFNDLIGLKLNLPEKYYPRKEFLQYHLDTIYKG